MKNYKNLILFVFIMVLSIGLTSCKEAAEPQQETTDNAETAMTEWTVDSVKSHVENWKETPKGVAQVMLDKYGVPNEITDERLVWHNNGDFAMTMLTNEEIDHRFPMPHKDCLLQTVNYQVPVEKYSDMARYDGSVILERTKGTMGARCDKEMANYLALNLAHDVATGNKSVDEARMFYTETIMSVIQGEKPEYTQKMMFSQNADAGYVDEPSIPEDKLKEMKK
ncbi:hypothetical protein [Nonlabens marinus]|uniref:Uncharacterized protein n=1 Tax=Nonlabens marinus S1-08 TaxID=1454201 RepID=W8VUC3_9FLAO|nr:hypothetical protein [Nonlabens marinus]BAO54473.1 hypothetical protein NMS_0464 [Nonlabens marinus S1-08]